MRWKFQSSIVRIFLIVWYIITFTSSVVVYAYNNNQFTTTAECCGGEIFSVAPMMGHTHRHFRMLFRQISQKAYLYTEMIPATQIVQAYEQEVQKMFFNQRRQKESYSSNTLYDPEQVIEVISHIQEQQQTSGQQWSKLDELLRFTEEGSVALQLGGRDPIILAKAAAIGAAYGYESINLNCGCPSSSVSGRQTGAALMREPSVVAECVEQMSHAVDGMSTLRNDNQRNATTLISVKHRLGVRPAATYNPKEDYNKSDEEAFNECSDFVRIVTLGGSVSRVHVHARLGLLGDESSTTTNDDRTTSLWVPNSQTDDKEQAQQLQTITSPGKKINHKRAQYRAKQKARLATIKNRSVPPLRPNVVHSLAASFPNLEFVTNGGIKTVQHVQERILDLGERSVTGAMVGRAVINHPCSFSSIDNSLWGIEDNVSSSRQNVLESYILYCEQEEERLSTLSGVQYLDSIRRKLISAPFHLFVGEEGNDLYQRRIRKLVSRRPLRMSSASILRIALEEVPFDTRIKPLTEFVPLENIKTYDFATKRSGPFQKSVF